MCCNQIIRHKDYNLDNHGYSSDPIHHKVAFQSFFSPKI